MAQHHALGSTGCAAGVEDTQQVIAACPGVRQRLCRRKQRVEARKGDRFLCPAHQEDMLQTRALLL
jgi:hypothetical protein